MKKQSEDTEQSAVTTRSLITETDTRDLEEQYAEFEKSEEEDARQREEEAQKMIRAYLPMTETAFYILLGLRKPNHGYGIAAETKEHTYGQVIISPGTMYGTLSKMEKDGLIRFVKEESKKKVYELTYVGTAVLKREIDRIDRLYYNAHRTTTQIVRSYTEITKVSEDGITFRDGSVLRRSDFVSVERDICGRPAYFLFAGREWEYRIVFDRKGLYAKSRNHDEFREFQIKLDELGIHSRDLS